MALVAAKLADERPDEVALRDDDVALSWADVNDALNRVANGLHALELGPDDRVAVFAENAAETVLAHLGGLLAGVSTVPGNFHLNADEMAYILQDSGAKVLFLGPQTFATGLEAAAPGRRPDHHRLARARDARGHAVGGLAGGRRPWRAPHRSAPAPEPHVHVGHHRPAQGRRAAAHDVRRGQDDRRSTSRRWPRTPSPGSAPTSWSDRCTTPVRCRASGCWPPGSQSWCSGGSTPRACCQTIDAYKTETSVMVPTHFVRLLALPDEVKAKLRRQLDEVGRPHRRRLPDRREAPDDRVVGADLLRRLRRHRGRHHVPDHEPGVARAPRARWAAPSPRSRRSSSTTTATSCLPAPRAGCTSATPPAAASSTRTIPRRRPPPICGRACSPSARSATSTTTATCSSPTASAT